MALRTQTVPNCIEDHRDVRWGVDVKLALAGLIITVLSAVGGGVWFLSAKLATIEMKVENTHTVAMEARGAAEAVGADLATKYAAAQGIHALFLTKDEFYRYMAPEVRRPRGQR